MERSDEGVKKSTENSLILLNNVFHAKILITFHEFTLAYNKRSKGLCVFGVRSEERAPSSVIIPEPGAPPRPGRGVRALHLVRTQNAPPSAPPCAGVETGWRWGVGVVKGCCKMRDYAGKTVLIIYRDSLSCWLDRWCEYWWWIGHVNYLCVLLTEMY